MSTEPGRPDEFRAQTIELFFDLVFVFVITQITSLVETAAGAFDLLHAFAVLMLIWWMYGGYIWLTNHVHTPKSMRLVLIAAVAGFMVLALAVPVSRDEGRLVFGLAYLFIILLHFAAFFIHGGPSAGKAMLRILPFNIAAAAVVIVAGMFDTQWSWILLLTPAVLYGYISIRNTGEGFSLNASHFVERHGLLLIIVLGETLIAVGTGLGHRAIEARMVVDLCLSIGLIATLWWSYFDADDLKAEHIMVHSDNRRRTRIAHFGYTACHLLMIAGLIMIAAGLRAATGPLHPLPAEIFLVTGTATYLTADALFRLVVGIRPVVIRTVTAALLVVLGYTNLVAHGTLLMAEVLAILLVARLLEERWTKARAGRLNP